MPTRNGESSSSMFFKGFVNEEEIVFKKILVEQLEKLKEAEAEPKQETNAQ